VDTAIALGDVTQSEWQDFQSKYDLPDDEGYAGQCCIFIPLKAPLFKTGDDYTFICVYLTQTQIADDVLCPTVA